MQGFGKWVRVAIGFGLIIGGQAEIKEVRHTIQDVSAELVPEDSLKSGHEEPVTDGNKIEEYHPDDSKHMDEWKASIEHLRDIPEGERPSWAKYVPEPVSPDQLKAMHAKIDGDADGKISMVEIQDFHRTTGNAIRKRDMGLLMVEMDADKDGKLSLQEDLTFTFKHHDAHASKQDERQEHEVLKFKDADKDGDGFLSEKELVNLQAFAVKDSSKLLMQLDTDKDGKVSLEEDLHSVIMKPAEEHAASQKEKKDYETSKFQAADRNADGFLDVDELAGLVVPSEQDASMTLIAGQRIKQSDKDGDGELSLEEFYGAPPGAPDGETGASHQAEFDKLDVDKNGKINAEELKPWETGTFHTHQNLMHILELADNDEDSLISADEIAEKHGSIMTSQAAWHVREWISHHEL